MKKYLIVNRGCDDETSFEIELDNNQLQLILKFCKLNNKSSRYGCQPTISVYDDYKITDITFDYYHKDEDGKYIENTDLAEVLK